MGTTKTKLNSLSTKLIYPLSGLIRGSRQRLIVERIRFVAEAQSNRNLIIDEPSHGAERGLKGGL
jgi:hypothetical protein